MVFCMSLLLCTKYPLASSSVRTACSLVSFVPSTTRAYTNKNLSKSGVPFCVNSYKDLESVELSSTGDTPNVRLVAAFLLIAVIYFVINSFGGDWVRSIRDYVDERMAESKANKQRPDYYNIVIIYLILGSK